MAALRQSLFWSAVFGASATLGSALATFLNPKDQASQRERAGNVFLSLRNDTRIFRSIDCESGGDIALLRLTLAELAGRRNQLNEQSPGVSRVAYLLGRRRIRSGETSHAVDATGS